MGKSPLTLAIVLGSFDPEPRVGIPEIVCTVDRSPNGFPKGLSSLAAPSSLVMYDLFRISKKLLHPSFSLNLVIFGYFPGEIPPLNSMTTNSIYLGLQGMGF